MPGISDILQLLGRQAPLGQRQPQSIPPELIQALTQTMAGPAPIPGPASFQPSQRDLTAQSPRIGPAQGPGFLSTMLSNPGFQQLLMSLVGLAGTRGQFGGAFGQGFLGAQQQQIENQRQQQQFGLQREQLGLEQRRTRATETDVERRSKEFETETQRQRQQDAIQRANNILESDPNAQFSSPYLDPKDVEAIRSRAKRKLRTETLSELANEVKLQDAAKERTIGSLAINPDVSYEQAVPEKLQQFISRDDFEKVMKPEAQRLRELRTIERRKALRDALIVAPAGSAVLEPAEGGATVIGTVPPRPEREPTGTFLPLTNEQGQLTEFFNPSTGRHVAAPEGARRMGLPAGQINRMAQISVMLDDAKGLKGLANSKRSAIGRIQGNWQAFLRQTIGTDAETNELFRLSDNLADQLLRARSGAQINEREFARLRALVPNPRAPESKFFSDLDGFTRELERTLKITTAPSPTAAAGELKRQEFSESELGPVEIRKSKSKSGKAGETVRVRKILKTGVYIEVE